MTFITTVPVEQAAGEVRTMYEANQASRGYVPNYVKVFSHRPQVLAAWGQLLASIRGNLDTRRYELITLAAARTLRHSYCMLAHGASLREQFYSGEQMEAIANGAPAADLDPADAAIMGFAEKVAGNAADVTQDDVDALRELGLSDTEIFDAAAAAAIRCFFSKLLDALGAEPDATFLQIEEPLRERLTVGRPISREPVQRLP